MKPRIRADERGAFRATRGSVTHNVTHMFTSPIAWLTPKRRARIALPLDIVVGTTLAIAILLNQTWWGGTPQGAINATLACLFGLAVATHRALPGVAVASLIAAGLGVVLSFQFGGYPENPFTYVAAAIVLFGSSAYGSPAVRTAGLGLSVFVSAVGLVTVVSVAGANFDLGYELLVSQGLGWLATSFLAVTPWLLGELVRNIRKRRALSAAVETVSTERDAALTRADLEAERTRVARDVHDIVAHSLTVVIAQADGARYATTADSPAAADAFGTIAQTARDALADVRTLLTELRHTQESGPQPGLANLDALFESFRDSGLELTVHEFGDRGRLTDARELALYRIAQESLTNALRHGDGRATLDLDWGDAAVDLLVTNQAAATSARSTPSNAVPATDTAAATLSQPGHGIDGMRERAVLAGGEFSIHEGATYRVRARLPREAREHPRDGSNEAGSADRITANTEVLA